MTDVYTVRRCFVHGMRLRPKMLAGTNLCLQCVEEWFAGRNIGVTVPVEVVDCPACNGVGELHIPKGTTVEHRQCAICDSAGVIWYDQAA